jgi:hypothetical protein
MVKNILFTLLLCLVSTFVFSERGSTQVFETRQLRLLGIETELPIGMVYKPLPAQKNLPLAFWGVRADTSEGKPQIGLQVFGFDARSEWSEAEKDTMLAFVYRQVFDTTLSDHAWNAFSPCPFLAPCFVHQTDTLNIDGEAYLGLILTSFHAPKQWAWVWYTTVENIDFLKKSAENAFQKLSFRPQPITDTKQRLTYVLPPNWVAIPGKDGTFRLVPRTQLHQNVLSEKMGYHTVEGYIFSTDSIMFKDMRQSLVNQGFTIAKDFTWDRFSGFEIHIGQPEDPGTHGIYLFWPPSGRMTWAFGFYYVSTTPLETEKVASFFEWLDTIRFMED